MKWEAALKHYIEEAFMNLPPGNIEQLGVLMADDVRFVDPFNRVCGRDAVLRVFQHTFEKLITPTVTVRDIALGSEAGYLRWTMTFRTRPEGELWTIEGMSEIRFASDGRVAEHIDHWDSGSQFYANFPLLGWLIERFRRRVASIPD
jgi:steroid delta-isomerase